LKRKPVHFPAIARRFPVLLPKQEIYFPDSPK
jgi:hypothetical protein